MFLRVSLLALVVSSALFGPAGRVDLPGFWLYVLLLWLNAALVYLFLEKTRPDLVAERMSPPSDSDTVSRRLSVLLFLSHFALAGLDARLGLSQVHLGLQGAGFVALLLGLLLVDWTLLSNPFASSAVRIQADRGQRVVRGGPYRLVRHPMYTGVLLVVAGSGLSLGSLWAALVLMPVAVVFLRRTLLEDRLLQDGLEGYRAYASEVRWRLVPGLF